MKRTFSLILMALFAGTAYSQELSENAAQKHSNKVDAPSPRLPDANTDDAEHFICLSNPPIPCGRDVVPPFTSPNRAERVADKKFWFLAAAAVTSSVLLVEATKSCRETVGRGQCVGHYGSQIALQGIRTSITVGMVGVSYYWKKLDKEARNRRSVWWVFPVGATLVNVALVGNQYSKHCKRGTSFNGDECE